MSKRSWKQAARARLSQLVSRSSAADLQRIYQQSKKRFDSLSRQVPGQYRSLLQEIGVLRSMLGSYVRGEYRDIPWRSLSAIAGAFVYLLIPLDSIPDFIPVTGFVDDLFVFKLVIDQVAMDMEAYRRWRDGGILIEHHPDS